ncbi:hypothetical protein [Prosthecochloris sp. GSB1]|uniref:hypothetical protein n=1 Tax=Prosthecochloris sp. GSB1 TaxID=281093 RepID=UPI003FA6F549
MKKLCKHPCDNGNNINRDIGNLVKKGLPVQIQKHQNIFRMTGNNAVPPGEMQLKEEPLAVSFPFRLAPRKTVAAIGERDGHASN